jgi:hypothetical protein
MKKVALIGLLMVVMAAFSVLSFTQEEDPALRTYTLVGGGGVILYNNLTGVPQDNLILTFDNPVTLLKDKCFIIGGGEIIAFKDILGDGTYWGLFTGGGDSLDPADFCVPGGMFQIYFEPVDAPAKLLDAFLG